MRPQHETLQIRVQLAQRMLALQRPPLREQPHTPARLLRRDLLLRQMHVIARRHHQLRSVVHDNHTSTHTLFIAQAAPSSV